MADAEQPRPREEPVDEALPDEDVDEPDDQGAARDHAQQQEERAVGERAERERRPRTRGGGRARHAVQRDRAGDEGQRRARSPSSASHAARSLPRTIRLRATGFERRWTAVPSSISAPSTAVPYTSATSGSNVVDDEPFEQHRRSPALAVVVLAPQPVDDREPDRAAARGARSRSSARDRAAGGA